MTPPSLATALNEIVNLEAGEWEADDHDWLKLIRRLESLLPNHASEAELRYAIGYCHYQLSDRARDEVALRGWLAAALKLDPSHQFAALYLGHSFYDTKQYDRALNVWGSIDPNAFIAIGQGWRVAQLAECKFAAQVFLCPGAGTVEALKDVVDNYLSLSELERAVPSELMKATLHLARHSAGSTRSKDIIRRVVDFARMSGFFNLLQDDVEELLKLTESE